MRGQMTIIFTLLFTSLFVLWALIKKPVLKWKLTIAVLLSPAFFIAMYDGYMYAAAMALAVLIITLVYDFSQTTRIIKIKIVSALPFIAFIIYMTNNVTTETDIVTNTSDTLIAVTVICLSLFVTGVGSILALTRTRGKKIND